MKKNMGTIDKIVSIIIAAVIAYNTSFTDIKWVTTNIAGFDNSVVRLYPNPATNQVTTEFDSFPGS